MKVTLIKAKKEPILLLGLSLVFTGFLLVVWKFQRITEEIISLRWIATTGTIESSNFYTSNNGRRKSYYAELSYRYSVNNLEYFGTRYDAKGKMQTGLEMKFADANSTLYKGAKVAVFYAPDDPSRCLLKNGISEDTWVRISFSSLLLLIGVNTTLKEWKRLKDFIIDGRKLD